MLQSACAIAILVVAPRCFTESTLARSVAESSMQRASETGACHVIKKASRDPTQGGSLRHIPLDILVTLQVGEP